MGDQASGVRELIQAARRGERDAQGALLARYRDLLVRLARRSLSRRLRPKIDASDVVQDVLVKAQQGLGAFRGATEAEVVGWLRQILARTLADADRRWRRTAARSLEHEHSLEEIESASAGRLVPAADGTSPSRGAERRETRAGVRSALAALKPDDREVILLRNVEGLEWSEIGRRMGRSAESVRCLWGRALRRLGERVEEQ